MEVSEEDERFGWGTLGCKCCQRFRSPRWVLAALSIAGILQGFAINGLVNVVISNLEKRFHLKSAQSGLIPSFYDIGAFFASFPIGYYGGEGTVLPLAI